MAVQPICKDVLEVGASDPDLRLYNGMLPTPFGTTYNTYVIIGSEKTALIDPVDASHFKHLMMNLKMAEIEHIDYIINLHAEKNHTGSLPLLTQHFPEAKLVGTARVAELINVHLHIPSEDFHIVKDGDQLELGGKTLTFYEIPFSNWPDSTAAMLEEDRLLFSGDLFSSHYATQHVFSTSSNDLRISARAFYAGLMMPFSVRCRKYLNQFKELFPRLVAPSHGPVWFDPEQIFSRYDRWTSRQVRRSVVIAYTSMNGSTASLVEILTLALCRRGISVTCRNIANDPADLINEAGAMMTDLVDAGAIILATPTYITGPHPALSYAASLINAIKPPARYVGVVGSYGWANQTAPKLMDAMPSLKAERLEPLMIRGLPTDHDKELIRDYANALADKLQDMEDVILDL